VVRNVSIALSSLGWVIPQSVAAGSGGTIATPWVSYDPHVPGVIRNSSASEKCPGCNGTGAPLIVAGDPTSGHDLNKTCGVCGGSGFVKAERKT
jgi:hypothetical protein